ncbi:unnamed protein product [Spirodela intermedia]|uniref:RRM domain-containing protein n=1 Tax=Spirodela intermedia TaxID=51605 RepID=A0A7I8JGC7_SPIIN|nr:unnamed protein product [Spirodela intermedia]CAA6669186.1 unnamed protein product [Spirodela intermedia]
MATKRKSEAEPEFAAEDEDTGEEEEELEELEEDEEDAEEGGRIEAMGMEEGDEESRRQSVRRLLEPFGKDQLIDFLKEAAARNPSVIRNISEAAESDPVHRKIFVHGLGWDATTEILADVFRLYGEIEKCNVVMDKATGKSKGFGFVLFRTRAGAQNALKQPQKKIGNRTTSCQLACFGPATDSANRKIYVTNVAPDVNPERLRSFFEKFGEIEEGQLGHDQTTGKSKGHAFFTYRTPEGCRKALEEPMKVFEGCQLHCKKAFEHWKANTRHPWEVLGPVPTIVTFWKSHRDRPPFILWGGIWVWWWRNWVNKSSLDVDLRFEIYGNWLATIPWALDIISHAKFYMLHHSPMSSISNPISGD